MAQKRSPHDALFRAAESAERAFHRRKASELRQNARAAQQAKNWALAEALWRQSLEEDPDERSGMIGLANALVPLRPRGQAGPGAAAVRGARHNLAGRTRTGRCCWPGWPRRAATPRRPSPIGARRWCSAPGKTQALIRLGRLSIGEGQYEEAARCAARLSGLAPDSPAGGSLLAEIAIAQGDIAGALAARKALAEKFPANGQILRDYGRACIAAGDNATSRRP